MRKGICIIIFLLSGLSMLAQGFGNDCTPAGTWYGGADSKAKYLLTVIPTRAGHFSIRFDEGFTPAIPKLSEFSGEMIHDNDGGYKAYAIALGNLSSEAPNSSAAVYPFVWTVREKATMPNCDTLVFEIYQSRWYLWGYLPFSEDFWQNRLPNNQPVYETYLRAKPE